jgi:acyl-coenzyme A thioesterase PaaI-like protein
MSESSSPDINPVIGGMLRAGRDFLTHEHALFRQLDMKALVIGRGKATFSLKLPSDFAGPDGAIHGGLFTIILDSIFGLTVFTTLEKLKPIATINLRTDYVAAAIPGNRVVCAADCEGVREDVAYVTGRLTREADGALIATGAGAFMIGTKGPSGGMRL